MPARSSSRRGQWQASWGGAHGGDTRHRGRSQSRTRNNQWKSEPFYWKCGQCSNIQSGSECKACKAKWWEVDWEKWAKPETTTKWAAPSGEAAGLPTLGTRPHHAMAAIIHRLAYPAPGAPPADPKLLELAHTLNEQLIASCPIEEKQKKLQSVTSKLEHHTKVRAKIRDRLQQLRQEVQSLQEEDKAQSATIGDLESERKQLVEVVKAHLETGDNQHREENETPRARCSSVESGADSESSQRSMRPPAHKRSRSRPTQKPFPVPFYQLGAETWDGEPSSLNAADLETLWTMVKQERRKRRDVIMDPPPEGGSGTPSTAGDL